MEETIFPQGMPCIVYIRASRQVLRFKLEELTVLPLMIGNIANTGLNDNGHLIIANNNTTRVDLLVIFKNANASFASHGFFKVKARD